MKVRLAVRPKIETVGPATVRYHEEIAGRARSRLWALRWLGRKYLCYTPVAKPAQPVQP